MFKHLLVVLILILGGGGRHCCFKNFKNLYFYFLQMGVEWILVDSNLMCKAKLHVCLLNGRVARLSFPQVSCAELGGWDAIFRGLTEDTLCILVFK